MRVGGEDRMGSAFFGRAAAQWDPRPAAAGEGVGMGSTEGPGHRGSVADTWLGTRSSKDGLEIPEQGGGRRERCPRKLSG